MTLTRSRLEQSHKRLSEAAGIIALAIEKEKLSRMELQDVVTKLESAQLLIRSILHAQG